MTSFADMKMAVLAALIVLTAVICGQTNDKLADAQSVFPQAPLIETQVLTG
ncbi:hypothetical protein [uncultured Ruegeria sp.]|uniref:hypothetical protein n=1 Tax=uncultured Ruegeria sp. TaxID=259304 RepID=UPI00261D7D63|nr:hypothetical protein [uncultured Ruegeria sp.]